MTARRRFVIEMTTSWKSLSVGKSLTCGSERVKRATKYSMAFKTILYYDLASNIIKEYKDKITLKTNFDLNVYHY